MIRILPGTLLAILLAAAPLATAGLRAPRPLGPAAQALVQQALSDLDPALPLVDCHVHIVGNGLQGSGIRVNPTMRSPWHPIRRFATKAYIKASGVEDSPDFDEAYVTRLAERAKGFGRPVQAGILAMDAFHRPDGTLDPERTEFSIPNAYVVGLAEQHPDVFVPVVSIHPARRDALEELDRWAARGVRWIKWLPNAQGIDPADHRYEPFYRRMRHHGMVLLTHGGKEMAVSAKGAQEAGNPLKLRYPLDLGVTVVVAHCASLGQGEDLDHPGRTASNFALFLRLMDEPRYRGRLYGDLSAITQANRMPGPLLELLRRPGLHDRLVNGSDYPLPGIPLLFWTSACVRKGLITRSERRALEEIARANPLLFDYVLKRTLRDPRTGRRLPPGIFQRMVRAQGTT